MNSFLFSTALLLASPQPFQVQPSPVSAAVAQAAWRKSVYEFSRDKLQHSAWGLSHCERDFSLALRLAAQERLAVDVDVLFAAAFLHDMGVFNPYVKEGSDHAVRATQVVAEVLLPLGFPAEKLEAVKETIAGHMYYAAPAARPEAIVLHDADTLDFLGAVGAARIFSVTGRHRWAPDMQGAMATLRKFATQLPASLQTVAAKEEAKVRLPELQNFLHALVSESLDGNSL